MAEKRIKLRMSEQKIAEILDGYKNDFFEVVEEVEGDCDLEKSSVEIEFVIQRKADGKFFQGTGHRSSSGAWPDENYLTEVFVEHLTATSKHYV